MTAIAIATLATSFLAVLVVVTSVSPKTASDWYQRILFFSGVFGFVWALSYLAGVN